MPTLDKYGPYILAAYGVAVVALGLLVLWTIWRAGAAKRKLDAAEAQAAADAPASKEKTP